MGSDMAGGATLSILGQHKSNMAVLHDLYDRRVTQLVIRVRVLLRT